MIITYYYHKYQVFISIETFIYVGYTKLIPSPYVHSVWQNATTPKTTVYSRYRSTIKGGRLMMTYATRKETVRWSCTTRSISV